MPDIQKQLKPLFPFELIIFYLIIIFAWEIEFINPSFNVDDYAWVAKKDAVSSLLDSGRVILFLENYLLPDIGNKTWTQLKLILSVSFLFFIYNLVIVEFCKIQKLRRNTTIIACSSIIVCNNIFTYELLSFDFTILSYTIALCCSLIPLIVFNSDYSTSKKLIISASSSFIILGAHQLALIPFFLLALTSTIFDNRNANNSKILTQILVTFVILIMSCFIALILNKFTISLLYESGYSRINSFQFKFGFDTVQQTIFGPIRNFYFKDGLISHYIKLLFFTQIFSFMLFIYLLINKWKQTGKFEFSFFLVILLLPTSNFIGWAPDLFTQPPLIGINLRHSAFGFICLTSIFVIYSVNNKKLFSGLKEFTTFVLILAAFCSTLELRAITRFQKNLNILDKQVALEYGKDNRIFLNQKIDELRHTCGVPAWSRNSLWRSAFHVDWSYQTIFQINDNERFKNIPANCM